MGIAMKKIITVVSSVILGSAITAAVGLWYYKDRGYTEKDVEAAYAKGQKDALNVSPPSEHLEIVCAALWFNGNTEKRNR